MMLLQPDSPVQTYHNPALVLVDVGQGTRCTGTGSGSTSNPTLQNACLLLGGFGAQRHRALATDFIPSAGASDTPA